MSETVPCDIRDEGFGEKRMMHSARVAIDGINAEKAEAASFLVTSAMKELREEWQKPFGSR